MWDNWYYLWRWLVGLEFLEIHVLNEIYTLKLSIWTTSGDIPERNQTLSEDGGR